jgi:hypothetical protein
MTDSSPSPDEIAATDVPCVGVCSTPSAREYHAHSIERVTEGSRKYLHRWARRLETEVASYPATSLAIGLAIGVLVGWLVKQR